jgi:hypothetical protein
MKRATKKSVAKQQGTSEVVLSMLEFQIQVLPAIKELVRNALNAGFKVEDVYVIADASPSFDVPVQIGWLPQEALVRSIPRARTERMREAMQDLLDIPKQEGWSNVLYYTTIEWQTTWLLLPPSDLVTSPGGIG